MNISLMMLLQKCWIDAATVTLKTRWLCRLARDGSVRSPEIRGSSEPQILDGFWIQSGKNRMIFGDVPFGYLT